LEASAAELSRAMAEGRTTAVALAQAYTARIASIDQAGPRLASVLEVNPDAVAIAAQLDAERAAGRLRGPLARHSRAGEGQHRHCRPHAHQRRLARADGYRAAA
jgi:hypothetical protein